MSVLKIKDTKRTSYSLKAKICIENQLRQDCTSAEYSFFDRVTVAFKLFAVTVANSNNQVTSNDKLLFIRLKKIGKDELDFTLCLSSQLLDIKEKVFLNDEGTWRLISENFTRDSLSKLTYDIFISVDIFVSSKEKMFVSLYEDSDLTDFVLKGKDGSVSFHRSILAAISPVLKKMLGESWKEAKEGSADLADLSKSTLQHLKDYIYTQKLPEDNDSLQDLLMLSKYYMIEWLEQLCVFKLIHKINAANILKFLDFSVTYQITELTLLILDEVKQAELEVQDIRKHLVK